MVVFEHIKFKNFLSYSNDWTELSLNTHGTTLIKGENGNGKSVIPTALAFGLFGKTNRGKKGQLVNSINGKELEVQIKFYKGPNTYLIIRGISPNKFEIYKNGEMLNQDSSVKDYQKYLENEILNINFKSFHQTIILSSSSFVPFMKLPTAQRREVIEDLLNISIFSKMKVVLKDRLDTNKTNIRELTHKITLQKSKLAQYNEYKTLMEQETNKTRESLQQKIHDEKKAIKQYKKDRDYHFSQYEDLLNQHEKKSAEHAKRLKSYSENKAVVKMDMKSIKTNVQFFETNDKCPTCLQNIDDQTKNTNIQKEKRRAKDLQDTINLLDEVKKIIDSEAESLKILSKKHNEHFSGYQTSSFQISSSESLIEDCQRELDKLKIPTFKESSEDFSAQLLESEKQKMVELERQVYLMSIHEMLKDNGIKGVMIKEYLPIINTLLNKYLVALDFFVSFQFDENFNEVVLSRHRDQFTFESFSEGEKARLNLAILFTWRQIAKIKNSTSSNVLFLDEVFSSVLDGAGKDKLVEILLNDEAENNIFVISHADMVQQMDFDRKLTVVKPKNFSKIEELESEGVI